MNDFAILIVVLGFGAVAWSLLVLSDWLLGEASHERK